MVTSAYYAIFSTAAPISCILAVLTVLSLTFEREALTARSILFSFQFLISPLFFLSYMVVSQHITEVILIAAYLELLYFAVYRILFAHLFRQVVSMHRYELSRLRTYLSYGTWLIVILAASLYLQGGVGIFSTGSRNDIVQGSRVNLYLVYASLIVQAAMTPIVAALINAEKRWTRPVILYLVIISIQSVLSASKGAAILTFLAVISLLKFGRMRDYFRILRVPTLAVMALFSFTVYFVGQFFSLEPAEFISLMVSRIFIANDGRALAIDWSSYLNSGNSSLFGESFRFYASLIGSPPKHPPLGELLYSLQFDTGGVVGANTSSTALLIAYGGEIEKIAFSIVLALLAMGIGLTAEIPGPRVTIRLAIGIMLLSYLSQDFLAFQVAVHTLVILSVVLFLKTILSRVLKQAALSVTNSHETTLIHLP